MSSRMADEAEWFAAQEQESKATMEMLAQWMIRNGFATGHGDTMTGLLNELGFQIDELRAKAKRHNSND